MSMDTIPQKANTDKDNLEVVVGTGEVLVDVNSRGKDRNWGLKKTKNVKMSEILALANKIQEKDTGAPLLSESVTQRFDDCGSWLLFNHYEDNTKTLDKANFCKHRLCPMCNWRKSIKLFGQTSEIVAAILADKKARFLFVTFTIENVKGDKLPDALNKMNEAFKWLFQKSKTYAPAERLKKNVMGYMKAVEITYNPVRDDYHPHIHCIVEVKPSYFDKGYLTHEDWRNLWKGAMHMDYEPMVNVKTIKNENGGVDAGAVAEVAKYPVKVDGLLTIEDIDKAAGAAVTLCTVSKNRRFVTFGGDFRTYAKKLKLDDVNDGDLVHVETDEAQKNGAVYQTLWTYNARFGVYIN